MWHYLHDATFSRFHTLPECDRHTDRQTDGQTHDDGMYRNTVALSGLYARLCHAFLASYYLLKNLRWRTSRKCVDWIVSNWQTNFQNYPSLIKFSKLPITIFLYNPNPRSMPNPSHLYLSLSLSYRKCVDCESNFCYFVIFWSDKFIRYSGKNKY